MNTNAQQNKSASKNRYKISNPFEATPNAINDKNIIKYFEIFKYGGYRKKD